MRLRLFLFLCAPLASLAQSDGYTLTDLSGFQRTGFNYTIYDLNNRGTAVGQAVNPKLTDSRFSFTLSEEGIVDLSPSATTLINHFAAWAINDSGQIAGEASVYNGLRHLPMPVVFEAGDLVSVIPDLMMGYGFAINSHGVVAGFALWGNEPQQGVIAERSSRLNLAVAGSLTPKGKSQFNAINDHGVAVGSAATGNPDAPVTRAAIFTATDTAMTLLGPTDMKFSEALRINNAGTVLIRARTHDSLQRTYLHAGDQLTDLGTAGGTEASGADLNNLGVVVGSIFQGSEHRNSFIYSAGTGMQDLTARLGIDPNAPLGYRKFRPAAINDHGQIIGSAEYFDGTAVQTRLVLATPNTPAISAQPAGKTVSLGQTLTLSVTAIGAAPRTYQWHLNGTAIPGANAASYTVPAVQTSHAGAYSVAVTNPYGSVVSQSTPIAVVRAPAIVAHPDNHTLRPGDSLSLAVTTAGATPASHTWRRNGQLLAGAIATALQTAPVGLADSGLYDLQTTNDSGTVASRPAIVAVASPAKLAGDISEVGSNIVHPNGNVYDQTLIAGAVAQISADSGQVMRCSFIDLDDDIVQVEMSGAGFLILQFDSWSGPDLPVLYNQNVRYMKGNARIVVGDADETTHLSVFSVGRYNAVNQSLFKPEATYDGIADLASIAISSRNGKFGGLRAGNAAFRAVSGPVGLYAPGVEFTDKVLLHDITAADAAVPMLILGRGQDVRITGGSLKQDNGAAVQVKGLLALHFVDGLSSHRVSLPAQRNLARLEQDGVDVTTRITRNPYL